MTDNEIIKANDLCSKTPQQCKICPFDNKEDCVSELARETIDLIKHQKAEIERLKSPCEMQIEVSKQLEATIKAEAIKEFAERYERYLLSQLTTAPLDKKEWINFCLDELDNLVKEMVGEG